MIWHPFTSQAAVDLPIEIVSAEREFLYAATGKSYIDAIASWWTVIHGHNHPAIVSAIKEQVEKLDHVMLAGFTHAPAEQLAEALLTRAGGNFSHVFYSDNGSTAVEVMLKLARQFWVNQGKAERRKFVRFDAAYHGDTFGAMSVAGPSLFTAPFSPMLFETMTFAYPQRADDEEFFTAFTACLDNEAASVAGVIIEPLIAAAGGMVFQQPQALRRLVDLCRAHGILVLFDEVFTGFGRTGSFFAYEQANVVPDLLALAKGLTGGALPLAATLIAPHVHSAFVSDLAEHTFYHGHTMTGNPIGCAAALASLRIFDDEARLEQIRNLENLMRRLWNSIADRHAGKIAAVRVMGALSAANLLSGSEKTGYAFSWSKLLRAGARAQGVVLRPLGNVLYVAPPHNIAAQSLERVFEVIDGLLRNYEP
jgi:adenosylmethionine-8-amino-7-oxononanoate aminotransferase